MGEKTTHVLKWESIVSSRETGNTFLQQKITLFLIDGWVTFVLQQMFVGIKKFWGVKKKKVEFKEGWISF